MSDAQTLLSFTVRFAEGSKKLEAAFPPSRCLASKAPPSGHAPPSHSFSYPEAPVALQLISSYSEVSHLTSLPL